MNDLFYNVLIDEYALSATHRHETIQLMLQWGVCQELHGSIRDAREFFIDDTEELNMIPEFIQKNHNNMTGQLFSDNIYIVHMHIICVSIFL